MLPCYSRERPPQLKVQKLRDRFPFSHSLLSGLRVDQDQSSTDVAAAASPGDAAEVSEAVCGAAEWDHDAGDGAGDTDSWKKQDR